MAAKLFGGGEMEGEWLFSFFREVRERREEVGA